IWRCWIMHNRSWLIITPSLIMWIAGAICEAFLLYYEATFHTQALVSAEKLHPFGLAFWILTVVLNVLTTTLLIWPIWKVARDKMYSHVDPHNSMMDVMHIIIESGLLYTIMAFVTLVTYASGNNALYPVASMVCVK
ncbi:hypothetical protein BDQ12DRAFT_616859, partial [Crucibulum laeve]